LSPIEFDANKPSPEAKSAAEKAFKKGKPEKAAAVKTAEARRTKRCSGRR